LVFPRGVVSAKALAKDLQVCGISVKDELGRVVDFHALRHSFATMLGCAGIEPTSQG
jgi:site-specific recombinase XerC